MYVRDSVTQPEFTIYYSRFRMTLDRHVVKQTHFKAGHPPCDKTRSLSALIAPPRVILGLPFKSMTNDEIKGTSFGSHNQRQERYEAESSLLLHARCVVVIHQPLRTLFSRSQSTFAGQARKLIRDAVSTRWSNKCSTS